MNREQAENMLDAYIEIHKAYRTGTRSSPSVDKACESMREVILDAMTTTVYTPITVQPGTVTAPLKQTYPYGPTWGSGEVDPC